MSTYTQLPGTLNLALRKADEFSTLVDFSIALTGYTVASSIVSAVTGNEVVAPTTTVVDPSSGEVNVSLTESQTSSMPVGTYRWLLWWDAPGDVRRTALTGFVEVSR